MDSGHSADFYNTTIRVAKRGQLAHHQRRMNKALAENWMGIVASLYLAVLVDLYGGADYSGYALKDSCEKAITNLYYLLIVSLIFLSTVAVGISLVFIGA